MEGGRGKDGAAASMSHTEQPLNPQSHIDKNVPEIRECLQGQDRLKISPFSDSACQDKTPSVCKGCRDHPYSFPWLSGDGMGKNFPPGSHGSAHSCSLT
jgi:hypothetical protein